MRDGWQFQGSTSRKEDAIAPNNFQWLDRVSRVEKRMYLRARCSIERMIHSSQVLAHLEQLVNGRFDEGRKTQKICSASSEDHLLQTLTIKALFSCDFDFERIINHTLSGGVAQSPPMTMLLLVQTRDLNVVLPLGFFGGTGQNCCCFSIIAWPFYVYRGRRVS